MAAADWSKHAMNRVNEKIEAYFEDELVSEAGQSAQTAVCR